MKINKGRAFLISTASILAIQLGSFIVGFDTVSASLTALVSLASMYIIGNVADNGVKGKFYNEGLKE